MVSSTKSIMAYKDCAAIFNRALQSKRGINVACESHGAAMSLRSRLNTYLKLDRKYSMRMYQPDDPKYGHSEADVFVLRVAKKGAEDDHIVRIERAEFRNIEVSDIPDLDVGPPDVDQLMRDLTEKPQ